ncbi:sulfotransferase family protein [Teredinibacter turnerae]|uniref:sulfotransferase family protein n=1 Tax=Teredinibacter turnerae TaxID=2426 RepID=UPI0003679802|nr:sulfotransferase [Teredinibacter turnerae]
MSQSVTLPNFFIIGAARSGTSSLYEYLRQHPQVFLSNPKEPMYFAFPDQAVTFAGPGDEREINRKAVTNWSDYCQLFDKAGDKTAVGEASANYLYSPCAAQNIAAKVPHAKLIAVLRNPVERAYSSYLYTLREGREPLGDFQAALAQEPERIANNWEHLWHYRSMGFYSAQLERYFAHFARDNIKIILQEDLQHNVDNVVRDVFEFLGVDPAFKAETGVAYNQGGKPKNAWLNSVLTKPSPLKAALRPVTPRFLLDAYVKFKHKNLTKPSLEETTRRTLEQGYVQEIDKLEALLARDLSHWRGAEA